MSSGARNPDPGLAREHTWLLRREYRTARKQFGPLPLAFAAYTAKVLERARSRLQRAGGSATEPLDEMLHRTALPDLFLAVACETGVDGAWQILEERFFPRLRQVIVQRGATATEAGEIVDDLAGDLVAPASGGTARIANYDGSGSLSRWLVTVVLRRHADRLRHVRPVSLDTAAGAPGRSDVPANPGSDGRDPAESALDAELGDCLKEALEESFDKLTRREYLAVHFKFRAGLPQRRIARLVDTDEPALSRILARAVQKIRDAVQRRVEVDAHPVDVEPRWRALKEVLEIQLQVSGPGSDSHPEGEVS